ncbi:kelch-like protein 23 [Fundulus heteroclitus]|uniref:kelch-like protein 23 n=1 Tax=Fundulus heteroclitus TaxID=8078 RepID=UPI00165A566B|nr:kelch-like protein 23 [Fundulus heteroclitus]
MSHKNEIYTYDFCDGEHPAELLEALRRFYVRGLFTDVTLQCGDSGQVFHCHRALLAARSSYFRVMFTADMRERSDRVVKLSGVDCAVLGALLDYVYTARVRVTEGNAQSLLEAADLLQFGGVKRACEDFLVRLLDVDNCLGMHDFAELHQCAALEREARRVMLSRFAELTEQEEFLESGHDRVRSVLAAQSRTAQGDDALIDGVVRWVSHDLDGRVHRVSDLLRSVHLALDHAYLGASLEAHRRYLAKNDGKLKSTIVQALRSNGKEIPAGGKISPSMYVIGGYYWHPLCEVHIWDPVSNTWVQGKDMPDPGRESYSVCLLGANIYVTGGYRTNTVEALDTVSIYNCDYDEWTEGCPMINARYYHCSVALHGCVYTIGGYRGGAPEQETEYYDPLKKRWFPVAKMIQGVGNATACVMGEKIYVTGGHYGYRGSCTYEKVQVFRPDVNEWSIATISPHPEYGLCSVSLNNKLYLVGGQTTVADCYDTESDEWRPVSVMKERRMECGAVVINGCIYVTGGYSYSKGTYLQSIEKYDPQLDSWEIVGTLPSPARSHGCVCVHSVH